MYHILIIEDDTDIRSELKLMLENALYQADGSVMLEIIMFSKSLHISLNPHP